MRELLEEFLTRIGYRVMIAADGKEALMYAERAPFSAALVDLKMPGMDGLAVLELLKVRPPGIAVIIMTGYPSLESAVGAIQKGAYDYVVKPFRLEEVEAVLQRSLHERALQQENQTLRSTLVSLEKRLKEYEQGEPGPEASGEGDGLGRPVAPGIEALADRMYRARSLRHQQTERLFSMIREVVQTQRGGESGEGGVAR